MAWLFPLLALAALAIAFKTPSVALLVLCLLVAGVLILLWVMHLMARRVESRSRNEAMMIDPGELHRLREQAEARKLAAAQAESPR